MSAMSTEVECIAPLLANLPPSDWASVMAQAMAQAMEIRRKNERQERELESEVDDLHHKQPKSSRSEYFVTFYNL